MQYSFNILTITNHDFIIIIIKIEEKEDLGVQKMKRKESQYYLLIVQDPVRIEIVPRLHKKK